MMRFERLLFPAMMLTLGCGKSGPPPPPPASTTTVPDGKAQTRSATPPKRFTVPCGSTRITIAQRSNRPLPGSKGQVLLTIDDITRGQVMTSVSLSSGRSLLGPISLQPDKFVSFELDGQTYTLTLDELRNELVADDSAAFQLAEGAKASVPLTEKEKIEKLICIVENIEDATFIRNDIEHAASEAAEHLRSKWKENENEIQTADDFIRNAASKSWVSGRPYLIRFSDGRQMEAAEFFRARLAEINQEPNGINADAIEGNQ